MTLEDYDQKIKPNLEFIAAGAEMCARRVDRLVARPWFETMAQAELERTRQSLETALAKISAAQSAYIAKPIET